MSEPAKGRRYPMNVVTFARRLHEQNGWSAGRIRKALMQRGYSPSWNTVQTWIDEDYAEERRELGRYQHRRRHGFSPRRRYTWKRRLDRLQQLREVGLSYRALAAVANLDFGTDLNDEQVRAIFNGLTSERTTALLLYPEGSSAETKIGRPRNTSVSEAAA